MKCWKYVKVHVETLILSRKLTSALKTVDFCRWFISNGEQAATCLVQKESNMGSLKLKKKFFITKTKAMACYGKGSLRTKIIIANEPVK